MENIKHFFYKHPIIFMGLYTVIYFVGFFTLEKVIEPKYIINCHIDDYIPFCEYFIIPYIMWFFIIPGTLFFLLFKDRTAFWKMAAMMFTGNMICLVIYTLFPNGVLPKEAVMEENIFCTMVNILYYSDTPTNVCPSIHVLDAMCAHIALMKSTAIRHIKKIRIGSFLYLSLVCIATVTLKQHSIIDVFAAILLGFILYKAVYKKEKQPELQKIAA